MSEAETNRARADIGFAEALDGFDPSEWNAPAAAPKPRVPADASRRNAEANGFVSREPARAAPQPETRLEPQPAPAAGQGAPELAPQAVQQPVQQLAPQPPQQQAYAPRPASYAPQPVPRQPSPGLVPPGAQPRGYAASLYLAPGEPSERQQLRRRRTGRNVQFNLKARPETIDAYCEVADAMGWGLGETLEYAVVLLQREFGGPQKG